MSNVLSILWAYDNLESPIAEDRAVANLIVLKDETGKTISVEQARNIVRWMVGESEEFV